MNNCPNCDKQPISLAGWCSGLNSLKCQCKHCHKHLVANMATWLVLLGIVVGMCLSAYISITQFGVNFKQDRLLFIVLISVPVLVGSAVGYLAGGYKLRN